MLVGQGFMHIFIKVNMELEGLLKMRITALQLCSRGTKEYSICNDGAGIAVVNLPTGTCFPHLNSPRISYIDKATSVDLEM